MRKAVLPLFASVLLMTALVCPAPESNHELFGHDGRTNHFARAPYLQLATPSSIVVVWRTDGENEPVVRYGRSIDAKASADLFHNFERALATYRATRASDAAAPLPAPSPAN